MKSISIWARHNKWQARFAITISWILLTLIGLYLGLVIREFNFMLPMSVLVSSIVAFLMTFLLYPLKYQRKEKKSSFYAWQKNSDFVVATASFIMIIYIANKPETLLSGYQSGLAAVTSEISFPIDSAHRTYMSIKDFNSSMKDADGKLLKWKERKKLLKSQIKAIRKADDMSKSKKTALIILSVIVAMGLLLLVSSAACTLSCNGSGAAALIVGIGGTALVVWLLIVVIRRIKSKTQKKQIKTETMASMSQ
ncbi:MAG: hypothetical protein SFU21_15875 [Flavihumibacter sp.]|nr:hypothetical protein [Flavihumibacter sp.]